MAGAGCRATPSTVRCRPQGAVQCRLKSRPGDGLQKIVAGLDAEGPYSVFLVCGDEDDQWGSGEPLQELRDLETIQVGHADVQEDKVVLMLLQSTYRVARGSCRMHGADRGDRSQQISQFVASRCLVVYYQGRCAGLTWDGAHV